jgi:serine/threonine protein kinase
MLSELSTLMAKLNMSSLAELALQVGVVNAWEVNESQDDPECQPNDPESLLRVMRKKNFLTPWQSDKLSKGDTDGYFLGGYKLLYLISSGSFGRVYRASDPNGTVVAIKVLRQRWSENAQSIKLFEREGKVGMSLQHPNIVQILAVNSDPVTKQHYIVMEFVEGTTLKDFLATRKKLTVAEAMKITEDAAAGLEYAAAKGMTHRDLKPTNILISTQGVAKLVDFGLAGVTGGADDTKVERTVDYAGLEKATLAKPNDPRSDIYFLGCVVYEMLSGRSPLDMTKDKAARMQKSRFENVQPLTPTEVQAPPAVFQLVEMMMALNPVLRYQSPQQLHDAVCKVRQGLEASAGGSGPKTLFLVEPNEKLQEAIRVRFKEAGFRVLLSADPSKALLRFQQTPFDALIVDAGATGERGFVVFREIMEEARQVHHPCGGVVMLSENQAKWLDRLFPNPRQVALVRPINMKQLFTTVTELVPAPTPAPGG